MKEIAFLARWSARISGLTLFLLILAFVVGEGPAPFSAMSAAFYVAWVGLLVLWRWRLPGGLMVVGGIAAFCCLNVAASGKLPGAWFAVWFVPGVLAIASWWLDRWKEAES